MRNVADIGLNILLTLLQKFASDEAGTQFFQTYFVDLMQHIFSVVTDTSHTASEYMYSTASALPEQWVKCRVCLSAYFTISPSHQRVK